MADETSNNADFIGRVVGDAKNPPETRMLTGWFGDSGEEGYRRLYTDAELLSYVDIPDDAILYTEPIRDAQPAGACWSGSSAMPPSNRAAPHPAAPRAFCRGRSSRTSPARRARRPAPTREGRLRCITQVPCGEVTGFTGQCTNEPQVGGAWPCITAMPHCYEVTGFTGKCTHQPWPNPTRYIGCTILHCPTHDLTHIPHICNIVATGLPGCGGVNPPDKGGDPAALQARAPSESADEQRSSGAGDVAPRLQLHQDLGPLRDASPRLRPDQGLPDHDARLRTDERLSDDDARLRLEQEPDLHRSAGMRLHETLGRLPDAAAEVSSVGSDSRIRSHSDRPLRDSGTQAAVAPP